MNSARLPCCRRITGTNKLTRWPLKCKHFPWPIVTAWSLLPHDTWRPKYKRVWKKLCKFIKNLSVSGYLAFTSPHAETSKPHTGESWGRCIRGGIAVGYSAFLHFPLKFLLLVPVSQSVVDELTQDCFSTVVEHWLLLCHDLSPTPVIFAFCTATCHTDIPVGACLREASS